MCTCCVWFRRRQRVEDSNRTGIGDGSMRSAPRQQPEFSEMCPCGLQPRRRMGPGVLPGHASRVTIYTSGRAAVQTSRLEGLGPRLPVVRYLETVPPLQGIRTALRVCGGGSSTRAKVVEAS